MARIFCSVCAIQNQLILLNSSWNVCIHDDILDMIQVKGKKLLHVKLSKSGQILRADKTCFPRPGHICIMRY